MVREILELKPRTVVEFWTDRKYYKNVVKLTTSLGVSWGSLEKAEAKRSGQYIRVRKVCAGKFHRYYGWGFKDYFKYWQTTLKDLILGNVLGFLGFVGGILQSFVRLFPRSNRPDVIFLKGGFVGLPVGLVARALKIPYVVHESDAVPGLANRMLMRKAEVVAMGMEFEEGAPNWRHVGIPVAAEFKKVSATRQRALKKACGFDPEKPLVVITGGSQGSLHMNEVTREILPEMLKFTSVGLVAGRKHYEDMVDLKKYEEWDKAKLVSNFRLWNFSPVMDEIMGAADVVVSRAGATTITELAALNKAVVLVPYEKLPGGHQVRNAEKLEKVGAALVVSDEKIVKKPELLLEAVRTLSRSPKKRADMAEALNKVAKPEAAKDLAEILIGVGKNGSAT